jgi:hypothetical protein
MVIFFQYDRAEWEPVRPPALLAFPKHGIDKRF